MTFSQDTTRTRPVKVSTLIKIKKDLDKCDSLRVAYFDVHKTLDSLIIDNNRMFDKFEAERLKKINLQKDLQAKELEFKKLFQKPNKGWLVPVLVGVTAGLVLGVSL